MKKNIPYRSLTVLTLLFLSVCSRVEAGDLMFYYFESCPSCEEYKLAEELGGKVDTLNESDRWEGRSRNLISPDAARELKTVLKEKDLPDISRSLPLLIINNEYINGYEAIGIKLDKLLAEEN